MMPVYLNKLRSLAYPFAMIVLFLVAIQACRAPLEKTTAEEFRMQSRGEAQGTTWSLVYYDLQGRDFKPAIDSILEHVDQSISTYKNESIISQWNKSDSGCMIDPLFVDVLRVSWQVYDATSGAFDPSVKPLVSFWGFGPEQYAHPEEIDAAVIDSLKALKCFDQLSLQRNQKSFALSALLDEGLKVTPFFLTKPFPQAALDFNAVGQGWSVDQVANYLEEKGVKVYFFELGGELHAGYPKPDGSFWRFGIDKPVTDLSAREMEAIINLRNKGLATSGSYRKFYEREGIRYSHTIDPETGYPVDHQLLSATVVADDAATADAYATAFMVMGKDSAISFLESRSYLNNYVYLISAEGEAYETYISNQILPLIEVPE